MGCAPPPIAPGENLGSVCRTVRWRRFGATLQLLDVGLCMSVVLSWVWFGSSQWAYLVSLLHGCSGFKVSFEL